MNFTTPALMFPALSLVLLAYTNRFLGLSSIVRSLYREYENHPDHALAAQIDNLKQRVSLIRNMQIFGTLGMLACIISITLLYFSIQNIGEIIFGISLLLMIVSFAISLYELMLSTHALNILLSGMEKNED